MSRYAVSDLHSCILTFKKALKGINFSKNDSLVIIGDIIDRHPRVKETIDFILQLQKDGYDITVLLGNHEDMMLSCLPDKTPLMDLNNWYINGGRATVESYGFTYNCGKHWQTFIPQDHIDFLKSLPKIYVTPDYVFVHASLNFYSSDPINNTNSTVALWERGMGKVDNSLIGGRMLITGHTPTPKDKMIEMVNGGSHAIIDRGCCFTTFSELGYLAVLNLDDQQLRFFPNIDNPRIPNMYA